MMVSDVFLASVVLPTVLSGISDCIVCCMLGARVVKGTALKTLVMHLGYSCESSSVDGTVVMSCYKGSE
jgi:hypothetical protein